MNYLERVKSRKAQGLGLSVIGGVTLVASAIAQLIVSTPIFWLIPAGLVVHGIYKWVSKKNYRSAVLSIGVGVALAVFLKGPLAFLFGLAIGIGVILLVLGIIFLVLPERSDR